jgi:pimeloyl-ACP methyl ester carboxylesterase
MLEVPNHLARVSELTGKLAQVFQKRSSLARDHYTQRTKTAFDEHLARFLTDPMFACDLWTSYYAYATDWTQRSILFWDTLRQRGNQYLEHERAGKPPVLHFAYETVLDARKFKRAVNYALLRVLPPKGVTIDSKRRPYIVIDPRAGHGPGIGGFKDDSQIGVALREGHPVYFIAFFPDPEPGQTLMDVTAAEQQFLRKVCQLHPASPKPVLIGNCQGGWAAMMLAVSEPDCTGPVVINGAPMSYWGGAWREGEGDNPMRYAAGLLGGTWLASLAADLGNGVFDGAWLVQNFENLNPANTFWDKYYHLFANADTEPPRYLEFERWWGGFFLMNREEIEWITQNLFVGNKLWSGEVRGASGQAFDLREIKSPIILFASLGDNITPPQQAFNWVTDVYGSTDEIKAQGQVIVGLLHQNVGHLGIFVSGRVAKKEHTQIVSVLKSIEALTPGLYGMEILERKSSNGEVQYDVQFVERRLEDVQKRLNRFERADEKPFRAVEEIADFNQRAYELFARPLVRAIANDGSARLLRTMHPLRTQHWAISDLNPWLAWLGPIAAKVKNHRRALGKDAPARQLERMSELISASLDYYREMRDAVSEVLFYQIYGNLFSFYFEEPVSMREHSEEVEGIENLLRQQALQSLSKGGYPEAVARAFALLERHGVPFPLARLNLKQELAAKFAALLPDTAPEQQRRIRGMQELIVRYNPSGALSTLTKLVPNRADRSRLRELLQRVAADEGVRQLNITTQQRRLLDRILDALAETRRRTNSSNTRKSSRLTRTKGPGKELNIWHP